MHAVIFDMDGLMIDSEGIYWAVARQMAREFGKEVSDETLGRMMGRAPRIGRTLCPRTRTHPTRRAAHARARSAHLEILSKESSRCPA